MANSIHQIQTGQRVSGTYHGTPYAGVVTSQRPHTMNHHITLFFVQLESPITVFGLERDGLVIDASDNMAALGRYLGGMDSLPTIQAVA